MSSTSADTTPALAPSFRAAFWTGWAAAACLAFATAYFGTHYFVTRSQLVSTSNDAEFSRIEAQSLSQRLEAERILSSAYIAQLQKSGDVANLKIIKLTAPIDSSPQTVATALWNPLSQSGLLLVENLPALDASHDYQLWLTDGANTAPVNSGIIPLDATTAARFAFRPNQSVTAATTFTITRERKGGTSSAPEGPAIATGTL